MAMVRGRVLYAFEDPTNLAQFESFSLPGAFPAELAGLAYDRPNRRLVGATSVGAFWNLSLESLGQAAPMTFSAPEFPGHRFSPTTLTHDGGGFVALNEAVHIVRERGGVFATVSSVPDAMHNTFGMVHDGARFLASGRNSSFRHSRRARVPVGSARLYAFANINLGGSQHEVTPATLGGFPAGGADVSDVTWDGRRLWTVGLDAPASVSPGDALRDGDTLRSMDPANPSAATRIGTLPGTGIYPVIEWVDI